MEDHVTRLQSHASRSKLAIFLILGFLVLITFLLITVSNQLASVMITTGSEAAIRRASTGSVTRSQVQDSSGPSMVSSPSKIGTAQCGEVCLAENISGEPVRKGCASGYTCESFAVGAGAMGVCRPVGGGSCPLPQAECNTPCSDEYGTKTKTCESGTTCTPTNFLGYHMCRPPQGRGCPVKVENIGASGDPLVLPSPTSVPQPTSVGITGAYRPAN